MIDYRKYREGEAAFSEINITPFTDIVLVLLIIFMIAAPGLLQTGLDIQLPGSSGSESRQPAQVTVALDRRGTIYLDGQPVPREELPARLAGLVGNGKNTSVILNADSISQHGQVVELLDVIRSSGARNIFVGAVKERR